MSLTLCDSIVMLPVDYASVVDMLHCTTQLVKQSASLLLSDPPLVLSDVLVDQVQQIPVGTVVHHDVHVLSGVNRLVHSDLNSGDVQLFIYLLKLIFFLHFSVLKNVYT